MSHGGKRVPVLIVLLVLVAYVSILARNLNESERRSLQLKEEANATDYVLVSIRVVGVDTNSSEMTTRMRFRLVGSIGKDEITPAADLKLLVNSSRGAQEFKFPKGERLSPIEATFALDGNVNKYPFDHYDCNIRMLFTTPSRGAQAPAKSDHDEPASLPANGFGDLMVSASALQQNAPVPISFVFSASVPGAKFQGQTVNPPGEGITGVALLLSRSDQVVVVSIMVMVLMMALALAVLFMAAHATSSGERLDLLPLSLSITLIFGLPALRNVQPGVPAVGAFGDYVSFIWAENIVALSAVVLMVTFLLRSRRAKPQDPK